MKFELFYITARGKERGVFFLYFCVDLDCVVSYYISRYLEMHSNYALSSIHHDVIMIQREEALSNSTI